MYDLSFHNSLHRSLGATSPQKTTVVSIWYENSDTSHYSWENIERTLQIDAPLFMLVGSEGLKARIFQVRNVTSQTVVHVVPFDQLPLAHYEAHIEAARRTYWPTRSARCTARVHLLLLSKFYALARAAAENPFSSEYFALMDANLLSKKPWGSTQYTDSSVYDKIERILSNPRPNCTLCCLSYWEHEPWNDAKTFYEKYRYIVVGGFVTISVEAATEIMPLLEAKARDLLEAGYGHGEEHLWGWVALQRPDLFSYSAGDYQDAIDNYHTLRSNREYVLRQVYEPAIRSGASKWLSRFGDDYFSM